MRRFLAVPLISLVLAVVASAAPVPKHLMKNQAPVYYYPTTVGAKWVYDQAAADRVFVVSKVEDHKGAKVVTVEEENGKQRTVDEVMEVSEAGLMRLGLDGDRLEFPLTMLRAPFRAGTTWAYKSDGIEGTGTIAAVEKIKVPAGTFEAVRVDVDYTSGKTRWSFIAWYAPNVGLLKLTQDDEVRWLLKSFTPGKE